MAKKHRNRKGKQRNPGVSKAQGNIAANSRGQVVARKIPEIPAFWVAITIPMVCIVGAWSFPPVATPMELKSYASQIYLSGLLFLWLWLQRKHLVNTLTFSPARIAFGLLFIAGTLSLLWASNPDFWVYKWNKWFAGFAIFLLGLHITQKEKNLDTIVNLAILGGLATASIGIAQYLFGFNLVPQTSFPSSTFGNGNMAGQVMVLTALLPVYFLFKERLTSGQAWFYAISLCLMMTYTYYTRTRAVWIACGFETFLLLVFIFLDKKRRSAWLHWNPMKTKALVAAIIGFSILINFNDEGFQPFWEIAMYELASIATSVTISGEESGGQRYLIWGTALEMIKANPVLGTGLGSFFDVYNTQGYTNYRIMGVQRVHNDVIELVVELGALGFVLLLGIIVTMCTLLFKLILHSEGIHRLLFALLTIAVTGSMLNAQLSFPYQLPVPLIIMPLYMAIVIRGAEELLQNTRTVAVSVQLKKLLVPASGLVFCFLLINDLAWMRDIHVLNTIVSGQLKDTPWKPVNPIFNQAYITGARSVNQALTRVGSHQLSLYVIEPILEYWPNTAANTLLAAENHLQLRNFEESEYWASETVKAQPEGIYIGQYYLMQNYMRQNDMDSLKSLYDSMKDDPEEFLRRDSSTYNMLHSMSINVRDFERTTYFFEKFKEYYGDSAPVIANQAVYHVNTGNIPEAIPYIKQALALNPDIPLASTFNQLLAQYPDQ